MAKERKPNTCFFCGKTKPNMFSGIGDALICSDCIEAGHQLVLTLPKQRKAAGELDINSLPTPQKIKDFLDQYNASSRSLSITTTNVSCRKSATTMWR